MSVYFYSRVSTAGQNSGRQNENFKKIPGFKPENLFVDKIQGNVPFMERPEAARLFDHVTSNKKDVDDITIYIDSICLLDTYDASDARQSGVFGRCRTMNKTTSGE